MEMTARVNQSLSMPKVGSPGAGLMHVQRAFRRSPTVTELRLLDLSSWWS